MMDKWERHHRADDIHRAVLGLHDLAWEGERYGQWHRQGIKTQLLRATHGVLRGLGIADGLRAKGLDPGEVVDAAISGGLDPVVANQFVEWLMEGRKEVFRGLDQPDPWRNFLEPLVRMFVRLALFLDPFVRQRGVQGQSAPPLEEPEAMGGSVPLCVYSLMMGPHTVEFFETQSGHWFAQVDAQRVLLTVVERKSTTTNAATYDQILTRAENLSEVAPLPVSAETEWTHGVHLGTYHARSGTLAKLGEVYNTVVYESKSLTLFWNPERREFLIEFTTGSDTSS
jgi:hypothetical protein